MREATGAREVVLEERAPLLVLETTAFDTESVACEVFLARGRDRGLSCSSSNLMGTLLACGASAIGEFRVKIVKFDVRNW